MRGSRKWRQGKKRKGRGDLSWDHDLYSFPGLYCNLWALKWSLDSVEIQPKTLSAKKSVFSQSSWACVPQSRTVTCLFFIPFSTARRWCARQGWALQCFLGQEDLGTSCWNLQPIGNTRCQGHYNLFFLLVLFIVRAQIFVSRFSPSSSSLCLLKHVEN